MHPSPDGAVEFVCFSAGRLQEPPEYPSLSASEQTRRNQWEPSREEQGMQ